MTAVAFYKHKGRNILHFFIQNFIKINTEKMHLKHSYRKYLLY